MKKKIKISLETDFNSKIILDKLKNFKKKKNLSIGFNVSNFENINLNFKNNLKDNDFVFFSSQIEKTFHSFQESVLKGLKKEKINKEILLFCKNIVEISKKNKHVFLFLWPMDTNDSYFGNLSFKKGYKSWLINYINLKVSEFLSSIDNIVLLDLNFLLLRHDLKIEIFDEKTKYLIGSSYSYEMQSFLSDLIIENIYNILYLDRVKLIVLDCDNTLWGGEAGEKKINELEIGPNSTKGYIFQSFQKRLKLLKKYGFILAICSKNYKKKVIEVFKKNKNMILNINDFSSIKANWENKDKNIKEILKELNLRSQNTLFIDDNPYERDLVKKSIPDIQILNFPNNLLNLNYELNNYSGLNKNLISETDFKRAKLYMIEKKRYEEKDKFNDINSWIKSLNIKIIFQKIKNFQRAEEMFNRTNQFNSSHIKYNLMNLKKIQDLKNKEIFQVSLLDKFGNYGIISCIIVDISKKTFVITDFVLSCRVFRRFVEEAIIYFMKNYFVNKKGFITITKNEKNKYVQEFLRDCDFLSYHNKSNYKIKDKISDKFIKKTGIKISNKIK